MDREKRTREEDPPLGEAPSNHDFDYRSRELRTEKAGTEHGRDREEKRQGLRASVSSHEGSSLH
jgi:hypothetical protein